MNLPPAIYKVQSTYDEILLREFTKHLIVQFQNQATGCRTTAHTGNTKKHADKYLHKAESYEYVVLMLQAIKFEADKKANPIPETVYYRDGNFYSAETRLGMGDDFYGKGCRRISEFPNSPEGVAYAKATKTQRNN